MLFVTQKKSVYVDSVAGSDANDGLTQATPKATCAAGMTVLASSGRKTIRLKCGSFFREQITLPAGKRLKNYGSGARPILDPRENAPASWTLTSGQTYTYQQTLTHALSSPSTHRLWEDGVRLKRVTSIALCESTVGSFFAPTPSSTSNLVYIHPNGDGDPNSNGKTYSYSSRMYGVDMSNGCTLDGIDTGWQGGNDGSIRALARNCVVRNCSALDGSKHNMLFADGAVDNVTLHDWEPIAGVGSQTAFILYNDWNTGTTPNATISRVSVNAFGLLDNVSALGFYGHGQTAYGRVTLSDCRVEDCGTAYGSMGASDTLLARCTSVGCYVHTRTDATTDNIILYRNKAIAKGSTGVQFLAGKWNSVKVRHSYASFRNLLISARSNDIRFCTFAPNSESLGDNNVTTSSLGDLNIENSVLLFNGATVFNTTATLRYVGNRNLYYPKGNPTGAGGNPGFTSGSHYLSFAQWKTNTGGDADSLVANPQITAYGTEASPAVFNASGPVYNSGFPLGVQPTDDAETLALLASVGYTP